MTADQWYEEHHCTHAHCPDHCEHPQPFMMDGRLVCGRCWFKFQQITPMLPCNEETCDE